MLRILFVYDRAPKGDWMTGRARTALSLVSGWIVGCVGGFIVLVFGPLLFTLPLKGDSTHEDNMLMLLLFGFFSASESVDS